MGDSVIVTGKEQNLKQQLNYNHETRVLLPGASIPMGQGGHVSPIFMKGGHPW